MSWGEVAEAEGAAPGAQGDVRPTRPERRPPSAGRLDDLSGRYLSPAKTNVTSASGSTLSTSDV